MFATLGTPWHVQIDVRDCAGNKYNATALGSEELLARLAVVVGNEVLGGDVGGWLVGVSMEVMQSGAVAVGMEPLVAGKGEVG